MEISRGAGGGMDFRRLPDIERLPPPYQVQLLSQARVQRCTDGQILFSVGDTDDAALYLIDGMVLMVGNDASVVEVRSNSPEARRPLDPSQPRRYTARAVGYATVLQVKRSLLDKLTSLAALQTSPIDVPAEATHDDPGNWMTRIARAPIFARLPPTNLIQLFEHGTIVEVAPGDIVMTEGTYPNHLHVVQDGEFLITRTVPDGNESVPVAELRPGDSFGAEALLTERPIDVNVKAATSGKLVRISREDFLRLIVEPLMQAIPLRQAGELVRTQRARWLDVRPANMAADIKGEQALHIPLNELRIRLDRLPRQVPYIVTSDNSACSRAGVFILLDAGLEARYLTEVAAVSTPNEFAIAAQPPAPDKAAEPFHVSYAPEQNILIDNAETIHADVAIPPAEEVAVAPVAEVPVSPAADISSPPAAPVAVAPAIDVLSVANPLAEVSTRIHQEIDSQMAALKQRVDQELFNRRQIIDRIVQDEVRRKTVEIETRYQLMVTRKEQLLRKSYERVLAMASALRQQVDDLHSAQNGFAEMLGSGLSVAEGDSTIVGNHGGERPL